MRASSADYIVRPLVLSSVPRPSVSQLVAERLSLLGALKGHFNNSNSKTLPGLEADGDVSAAGVNDALGQNGAKLCHYVLVFVTDHLGVQSPEQNVV